MKRTELTTVDQQERLAEIRQQIAAGTYETPERLSVAVDGLLDDLAGRGEFADDYRPRKPR